MCAKGKVEEGEEVEEVEEGKQKRSGRSRSSSFSCPLRENYGLGGVGAAAVSAAWPALHGTVFASFSSSSIV